MGETFLVLAQLLFLLPPRKHPGCFMAALRILLFKAKAGDGLVVIAVVRDALTPLRSLGAGSFWYGRFYMMVIVAIILSERHRLASFQLRHTPRQCLANAA